MDISDDLKKKLVDAIREERLRREQELSDKEKRLDELLMKDTHLPKDTHDGLDIHQVPPFFTILIPYSESLAFLNCRFPDYEAQMLGMGKYGNYPDAPMEYKYRLERRRSDVEEELVSLRCDLEDLRMDVSHMKKKKEEKKEGGIPRPQRRIQSY